MARGLARLMLFGIGVVLGLALILLLALGGLVWRLDQGPLDATAFARRVEASVAPNIATGHLVLALRKTDGVHMLTLHASDLARQSGSGGPTDFIGSLDMALPVRGLLHGSILPAELTAADVRLRITRPSGAAGQDDFDLHRLDSLRQVTVTGLQAVILDPALQTTWRISDGEAHLRRQAGGALAGQVQATLAAGAAHTQVSATGSLSDAGAQLDVTTSAVSPAGIARAVPAFGRLSALDAQVALHATASFGPGLAIQRASLHAEAGPGTVILPASKGGTSPGQFAAASLDAEGTPDAMRLKAFHLVLQPQSANPPTNVVVSGTLARGGGRIKAQVSVDVDQAALADLGSLWPERVGGGSRPWLVQNLSAGLAHDGHFTFALQSKADGSGLALTQAGGQMLGDDVTVWWLRPVPPLEHGHVVLSLVDPDTLLITATGARTGKLLLRGGTMRITGLSVHDQNSVLNADMTGPFGELVTLLSNPRLGLLSKRPIPGKNPSGAVAAHLTVNLPLETKVTIDQIGVHVLGKVSDGHLGAIFAGRDLDHGEVSVDVTNDGLSAAGTADVDQLPTKLQLNMDFRDGPGSEVLQRIAATVQVTPAAAKSAGLGVIGLDAGVFDTNLRYAERRDGTATIKVAADLTAAAINTPIGWSKVKGTAGHAEGRAELDHGRLVALEGIKATAPGLDVVARSELAGGHVTVVQIERGEVGRSSATGTIALPQSSGQPYRVTLAGPRLDLEGRLGERDVGPAGAHPAKPAEGAPYAIDLRFDRVTFAANHGIGPVAVTASGTGTRLTSAHLVSRGPERVEAELVPGGGERRLRATTANLGLLLRETDVADKLAGGAMTLTGAFDDRLAGSPFAGTIRLRSFSIRGAPEAGKVLQALTVYGIADALRGPGLAFDKLVAPIRIAGPVLDVEEARAFSASLGVTAKGSLDFASQTIDLTGTIVPAYMFNSLPGRIPLVGRLFSPEKGSGLFAANFALKGALNDPAVSINPLSALTPGFLRNLF